MTKTQTVALIVVWSLAVLMAGHALRGWWLLARAETRLRPGLAADDVETFTHEGVDAAYLSPEGLRDRRRGWQLVRRAFLLAGVLAVLAVLGVAVGIFAH